MSELVLRINDNNNLVTVEQIIDGVKTYKEISPNNLLSCIAACRMRDAYSSGLLPKGCISYTYYENGAQDIYIHHTEQKANITYYGATYEDFPLPNLVFGFHVTHENRVSGVKLGVISNNFMLTPTTPMFYYPFANVHNDGQICLGNNVLPKCESLHTLGSLPYYILSMDNNNDLFNTSYNKVGLEMRGLLELLRDKNPEYYYSNILVARNMTLEEFIARRYR